MTNNSRGARTQLRSLNVPAMLLGLTALVATVAVVAMLVVTAQVVTAEVAEAEPNASAAAATTADTETPPEPAPVDGRRLRPFDATWSQRMASDDGWQERGGVHETLEVAREGGREVLVRQQTTLGAVRFVNTTTFDRRSLAPLRFERRLAEAVPTELQAKLEANGILARYRIDFEGRRYVKTVPTPDGGETSSEGTLSAPAYEGSVLGLVVAALPLEPGFSTRLPVAFLSPQDGSISEYLVEATVRGEDTVSIGGGATTTAWLTEIAWIDPATGEVTSAAGADAAGGAYWILPEPRDGLPHVPKYRNETVDFELRSGD